MLDLADIPAFVFGSASAFFIIEAIFGIMDEIKRKDGSTLSQATTWIRSLLMIVMAIVMLVFIKSTATTSF